MDLTGWKNLGAFFNDRIRPSGRHHILNADPLFHQPGFVECEPSVVSEYFSLLYNGNVLIKSKYNDGCHDKDFEALVIGHFRNRLFDIL
ncbi:hypothetical protein Hanom_Chr05g00442611 [Helianthus anomalus]